MRKKILAAVMAGMMLFSLAACGSSDEETTKAPETTKATEAAEDDTTKATEGDSTEAAGDLSGGQQQMVAIGRGIMADPKLLILDEPSIGLSPLMTQKVLKAVQAIRDKGVSVLISEQNVMAVLGMANRAYVMQQGKIILSGTAEELKNNDAVRKAYMGI